MTAYYVADPHTSQFDGSFYSGENCTPTTGANGAKTISNGRISRTGAEIRGLVHRWEESDPSTPGWSLPDLALAMFRLGVGFNEGTSGSGWDSALSYLQRGYYIAVQGVSSAFGNNTCSGAFNGPHCVGINPRSRDLPSGENDHWIDDPICPGGRWENTSILHQYAAALDSDIRFGVFTTKVPLDVPHVALWTGARKTVPFPDNQVVNAVATADKTGKQVNVRLGPSKDYQVADLKPSGTPFLAFQYKPNGGPWAGSRGWYGNVDGNRWIHESGLIGRGGAV